MSDALIHVGNPDHRLSRRYLEAPGGFVWWYLDLIDDGGSGVVLIWSFGLPFLPGCASSARRGAPERPAARPSLNIAVYDEGRLDAYLLQEYDEADASWGDHDEWQFGATTICTCVESGTREVDVRLDCALPGTRQRLTGRIQISGPVLEGLNDLHHRVSSATVEHDWSPLCGPATGRASLDIGGDHRAIDGRAYHDRNGGLAPLHDLGIEHWLWGRLPFEDREVIYYVLWPEDGNEPVVLGIELRHDGSMTTIENLEVDLGDRRQSLAGMPYWDDLELRISGSSWLRVDYDRLVDEGPFYLRFQVEGTRGGATARGFAEACRPARVDRDWQRPLVRMRVHRVSGNNSVWLPLFSGPRQGRVRRLVQSWLGGAA